MTDNITPLFPHADNLRDLAPADAEEALAICGFGNDTPTLRQSERDEAIRWALEELARAKAHLASAEHALALLDGGGDEVA